MTTRGREVPPTFKELLLLRMVHKPTFRERLRLLFGLNLLIEARIVCQHRVGKTQHKLTVTVTDLERAPTARDDIEQLDATLEHRAAITEAL